MAEGVAVVKLIEVAGVLEARIAPWPRGPSAEITVAYAGDQMSDVLANSPAGALLLTGLTNGQVVRTAEVAGLAAIAFVGGKRIPPETVLAAEKASLPVLQTQLSMFECCGRLYRAGVRGGDRRSPAIQPAPRLR
jgi:hypothetical protein